MGSYQEFFRGKRVTVMGLGLLGRGVGDAVFLAKLGCKLTVTDLKGRKELAPSLRPLKKYKGVKFVLGGHKKEDFRNADFILKAAGVPLDSPYIKEAQTRKIPVYMSTALFAKFAKEKGATIIGVTGTRGKSTVAHLLFHILKVAKRRVHLGGNIRGLSTLAMLPKIRKEEVVILELDSWQLQGFKELRISPAISIFTNFMEDHLNYYPSMKRYFEDKAAIFAHQNKSDALIAGPSVAKWLPKVSSRLEKAKAQDVPKVWRRNLPGIHNDENVACAMAAAGALGVPLPLVRKGAETFKGVEGRLDFVREVRGISIWNDNNATTPTATVAALRSLRGKGRIVLIMGGHDKKLSLHSFAREVEKRAAHIILLPGTGTNLFKKKYKGEYTEVYSLKDAVSQAMRVAESGDQVLFSPAFASFGLFKNEYERNDLFLKMVRSLR